MLILRRQTSQERSDVWYGHDEKALAEKDDERGDPLAKPAFESSDRLRTFDVMLRQDSIYRCVESIHTGASTEFSRQSNVIGAVSMRLQSPVTAIVINQKFSPTAVQNSYYATITDTSIAHEICKPSNDISIAKPKNRYASKGSKYPLRGILYVRTLGEGRTEKEDCGNA